MLIIFIVVKLIFLITLHFHISMHILFSTEPPKGHIKSQVPDFKFVRSQVLVPKILSS